jgi:hypothetical protein
VRSLRDKNDEASVLAAVGAMGGRSWREVREHARHLDDGRYARAVKRLIDTGAITRQGPAHATIVGRNLRA